MEHLLSPHAWIQQVHQDTISLVDLSVFRCSAWCSDPNLLPRSRKLWVTEPPVAAMEDPPVKRVLEYDIDIRFSVRIQPGGSTASPPPPPGDSEDQDASARRRRRMHSPSPPHPSGLGPAADGPSASGAGMSNIGGAGRGPGHRRRDTATTFLEPVCDSQAACVVPLELPSDELRCINSSVADGVKLTDVSTPKTLVGGGPSIAVAAAFSSDEAERFLMEKDLVLPRAGGGPRSEDYPDADPDLKSSCGDVEVGFGGATVLPASPRSPLVFHPVEATVEPASPQSPFSPISESNLLVASPLLPETPARAPKAAVKPLQVYSRRRRCLHAYGPDGPVVASPVAVEGVPARVASSQVQGANSSTPMVGVGGPSSLHDGVADSQSRLQPRARLPFLMLG